MQDHFTAQLSSAVPLTQEVLDMLNGAGYYYDYQVGDKIVIFCELRPEDIEHPQSFESTTEREFNQLEIDFSYVRHEENIPFLVKKDKEHLL